MESAKMRLLKEMKAENMIAPEDLDEVSAGTCYEMADDSRFLNVLLRGRPGHCDRYGATRIWFDGGGINNIKEELTKAWASVGVKFYPSSSRGTSNSYFLESGKRLTQNEAWAHAEQVVGRHLQKSDWYW